MMGSGTWPATVELRALLDALLATAPTGAERVAIRRALAMTYAYELVPLDLAPAPPAPDTTTTSRRPQA